ncbi:hypothetical protein GGF32_006463, partial [Allomyces javanicus]
MDLFEHQQQALERIKECTRGIINVTCGGGKSKIMQEAARECKMSVVFAPTKNLVAQLFRDYFSDSAFTTVVVNSDNVVGDDSVARIKQATTSGDRLVVLANYQSFHVVSDLFTSLGLTADIAMFDEAHNVTSKVSRTRIEAMVASEDSGDDDETGSVSHDDDDETGSVSEDSGDDDDETGSVFEDSGDGDDDETGSVFEDSGDGDDDETGSVSGGESVHVIDMSAVTKLQARKTIFFTATPTRVMKAYPDIYGDELVQYTYAQAVRDGVVKNIDTLIECYAADDSSCLDAGYDRLIPSIDRFIKDARVKRVIVYTSHVRATRSAKVSVDGIMAHRTLFSDGVHVHAITASTPSHERERVFGTFKRNSDAVHVIVSCRTISEGIDLPTCDAVVVLDPSRSVVANVQRALRVCRLTPDERNDGTWDNAVVFYPINVPGRAFVEAIDAARDGTAKDVVSSSIHGHAFEFAMAVVNFLKNELNLDVLYECRTSGDSSRPVRQRRDPVKSSAPSQPRRVTTRVSFCIETAVCWTAEQFQESATLLATSMHVTSLDERWHKNRHAVGEFADKHGQLPSRHADDPGEKRHGKWVKRQRTAYRKSNLAADRVALLEAIPHWTWDHYEEVFVKNLGGFQAWIADHSKSPSQHSSDPIERSLGRWATDVRRQYRLGELPEHRIPQLKRIGFDFYPRGSGFAKTLAKVKHHFAVHRRAPSASSKDEEESKLGRDCAKFRQRFKKGELSRDHIAALEAIPGWWWTVKDRPKTSKTTKRPAPADKQDSERAAKRPRGLSTLSEYHKRFKSMSSSTLHALFKDDPQLFHDYHAASTKNWAQYNPNDRPVAKVAAVINDAASRTRLSYRIVDMGAGLGELKDLLGPDHDVVGMDHVSTQPWIHARDMSDTGLPDASVDAAVFSMSLWGSNWTAYIQEAVRVLRYGGIVVISDSSRRWFCDDTGALQPADKSRLVQ